MNSKPAIFSIVRVLLALTILAGLLHWSSASALAASQFAILGPSGSVRFGTSVTVLPNGNIVVTDPYYDGGFGVAAGAAYLYNGASGDIISMLTGEKANDLVGGGGVVVLSNGNYLVRSPHWHNGAIANAGAVTWGSALSGFSGSISAANSLVGSTDNDYVGLIGVYALSNGNYVVSSPLWDNNFTPDAGAVTWGNGTTGVSGAVSALNSLVGSSFNDHFGAVQALSNGNYVVFSSEWDNAATVDAGAVTWVNGTTGRTGVVSAANSLVGSTAFDGVGYGYNAVIALSNGNYVVRSSFWDNIANVDAGAVTWGDGTSGITGPVSALNSLVGSSSNDNIGAVQALSNGNYVVFSSEWDNAATVDAGAVTWVNGTTGRTGVVTALNSLVGSQANDKVGRSGVAALSNGNYVVSSPYWDNALIVDAGAVTWGNGTGGIVGTVSTANSLVGSQASDQISTFGVTALSNGNYVVRSPYWDNALIVDAGAVTWRNGTGAFAGPVTTLNSLLGSTNNDQVGLGFVTALSNGNYVVNSYYWDNGGIADAGAATWGIGTSGITGPVSALNSLVGSQTNDQVSLGGVTALSNGSYVVRSPFWDNGAIVDAGAVTWGNALSGVTGAVSALNSLVGSTASDQIGIVTALSNGNYVVGSSSWDNGASAADAGAVTWGSGTSGVAGPVTALNSLVGSIANDHVYYVVALSNGNYLVSSPEWDNTGMLNAGAVTWVNGSTGLTGVVSAANSLVGSKASDYVGSGDVTALSNGNYVVISPVWDYSPITDAGAVTWGYKPSGAVGPVSGSNSVRGSAAGGGPSMVFQYDASNHQLVVGRPADNIVTLFKLPYVFLPVVSK